MGAIFLVAAAVEAVISPLTGRLSDRRGRLAPIRVGLGGLVVMAMLLPPETTLLAGAAVIGSIAALGMFWAPAMALLSDASEAAGLDQGLAFALANSPGRPATCSAPAAVAASRTPPRTRSLCATRNRLRGHPGGGRSPASRRAGPGARRALTLRRPGAQPYAQAGQEQRRCADRASAPGDPAATPGQPRISCSAEGTARVN